MRAPPTFTGTGTEPEPRGLPTSFGLDARLLAEAIRLHEDASGAVIDDPAAEAMARSVDGDAETRILVRAEALAPAPTFRNALQQVRGTFRVAVAIAVLMAVTAAAATAHTVVTAAPPAPVNIFVALTSLLGVNLLALALWAGLILVRPAGRSTGFIGRMAFAAGRRLSTRLADEGPQAAAARAAGRVIIGSPVGRWRLSAVSHGVWLAFLLSGLITLVFVLSTRHVTFGWETTILSERQYIALTHALAWLPAELGFVVPDTGQVTASRWTGGDGPPAQTGAAWSGFLGGCLIAYGIVPRAVLLIVCLVLGRRAAARYRLDTSLPGYARLAPRLMPMSRSTGIVDPERPHAVPPADHPPPPVRDSGPTAILGLEMPAPAAGWPPAVPGIDWLDLGSIDSSGDRHRAMAELTRTETRPRLVVVVCALPSTPDRGVRSYLADVQETAGVAVFLLLTGGQRLRQRSAGDSVRQRLDDWRRLAAEAGIPDERIIETDLDHLTEASRDRLARWLNGTSGPARPAIPQPAGHALDRAFARIVEHAGTWCGRPDDEARARLHRAIAAEYRSDASAWHERLGLSFSEATVSMTALKDSAGRLIDVLPDRLRRSRRWLVAGAAAGALGCVAAAALVTPVALAALPAWTGLSALIGAAIAQTSSGDRRDDDAEDPEDLGDAVAAAALFALVLHLQGHDERAITETLDRVMQEAEPPRLVSAIEAADWLATLRRRLDALGRAGPPA